MSAFELKLLDIFIKKSYFSIFTRKQTLFAKY